MRIKGLEMLVFRQILCMYLMDDPQIRLKLEVNFDEDPFYILEVS